MERTRTQAGLAAGFAWMLDSLAIPVGIEGNSGPLVIVRILRHFHAGKYRTIPLCGKLVERHSID